MASEPDNITESQMIDALRSVMLELAGYLCASKIRIDDHGVRLLIVPYASHGGFDLPAPVDGRNVINDIRLVHRPLFLSTANGQWAVDYMIGQVNQCAVFPTRDEALDFIKACIEGYWLEHDTQRRRVTQGSPLRKVYLDDERTTPEGWIRVYWPDEAIALLETGNVAEISLDHDLGDDARGTGYDVIAWIEEAVATRGFAAPTIRVHSANPAARTRMEAGIAAIERLSARF